MKKFISVILAICMILSFCVFPISAEKEANIIYSGGYAYGIKPETLVSAYPDLTFLKDGETVSEDKFIGTGMTLSPDYTIIIVGDTSGDGKINSTDFMQVRKQYLGLFEMTDSGKIAADVNCDGKINSTDFMQIRKHYLSLFDIYENYKFPLGDEPMQRGITWEEGQAFPTFSPPAKTIDTVSVTNYTASELLAVTALQGIVNRTQPRIFLYDNNPDEGAKTWAETDIVGIENVNELNSSNRFDLFTKYADEIKGGVLYSDSANKHFRNLASTVAATRDLIPVTKSLLNSLRNRGIDLEVKVDLTTLSFNNNVELYNYLYDNYWQDCNHRLLISHSPNDAQHIRDMAAATGSAVVYLDCTNAEEKAVFEKFLGDMEAGNGIVFGWFTTERSGITTVTSHGLSTVPGDLYINSTFYSGTDNNIMIPSVPNKPQLENKLYVALYISDGDNVQYNQRYMRKLWDQSKSDRGKVAINWTISPALCDLGPAIMNYYYSTATEKDCFVCGPSGLGYSMPINTLAENGAPAKNYLEGKDDLFKEFVTLTDTYLERTGLRVVTVWDNLSDSQRKIYTENSKYIYGLTLHDWFMGSNAASSVENGKLCQQLTPCYASNTSDIKNQIDKIMADFDGSSPLFFSAQATVWGNVKPADIVRFEKELNEQYDGQIEFVRADHYFALYNEANGLPYDLTLCDGISASATSNSDDAALTLDGTPYGDSIWCAKTEGEANLTYDLGKEYQISRIVLRHAEANGLPSSLNNTDFIIEATADGLNWATVFEVSDNTSTVTDAAFEDGFNAIKIRITITKGGKDLIARLSDVEIYGIS